LTYSLDLLRKYKIRSVFDPYDSQQKTIELVFSAILDPKKTQSITEAINSLCPVDGAFSSEEYNGKFTFTKKLLSQEEQK
jgi:hypothetical protein